MAQQYTRRYVDEFLDGAMQHLPAFMLVGPRGCGKTTTAARRAESIVRLDEGAQAELFEANPRRHLAELDPPVLIDEWQVVPESLVAVKHLVDSEQGAGRFLVTGSVRAKIKLDPWPGTGRITPIPMFGLTRGELLASEPALSFIDRLFSGDLPVGAVPDAPSVFEYAELIAAGGFPEAMSMPSAYRSSWYEGYVELIASRDVAEIATIESPRLMRRLLRAAALNSAGLPTVQTLVESVGASRPTVERYVNLLEELSLLQRIPRWESNRLKRMVKTPKLHLTDTGLALWLAGLGADALLRDSNMLGRLMDSFVLMQLRPLFRLTGRPVDAYHLRDANGRRKVDLILESQRGEIVVIEVKATGKVTRKDVRHLEWLRDEHPEEFVRGVIFHTGETAGEISDRIWSLPIAAIWS